MSFRSIFVWGFLTCVVMLSVAGYFQFVEQMEPCPLCVLQRIAVLLVAFGFLLGMLHNPKKTGRRVYGGLIALFAGLGGAVAGYQVWLQNLPKDQVPTCGPGFNYILDNFPVNKAIDMIFHGSGECAEIHWQFLGLTIPGWTLVAFVLIVLAGVSQLFGKHKSPTLF